MRKLIFKLVNYLENIKAFRCIRRGLVMTIPILLVGSMALVFKSLPISIYQKFISTFASGLIYRIANFIYDATFGALSIFITFNIGLCYAQNSKIKSKYIYGAPLISLGTFMILIGASTTNTQYVQYLGVKGMFCAIFSSLIASHLYEIIVSKKIRLLKVYADGVDTDYNNSCSTILPAFIIMCTTAIFNFLIQQIFKVSCFQDLFVLLSNKIFDGMGRSLASEILFTLFSSILWLFGIHGSNVLENVAQNIFAPGIVVNMSCIANGLPPLEIISKTFFDVFVIVGGCGATLSLLIAILLFSKRKSSRGIAKFSLFPMIFNINELIIFGLPIIFNPIFFIPFIITPIVFAITTYLSMKFGLVPYCISTVEWTTPVIMSGYVATGSINGSILQVINVIIGVFIYKPFVKMYDEEKTNSMKKNIQILKNELIRCEEDNQEILLLSADGIVGDTAKMLVEDLKYAISHDELNMFYQPQYDNKGACTGAEALLRWQHSICGMIYPPLVIKLADEAHLLSDLEKKIFKMVTYDLNNKFINIGDNFKVCVNITAKSLQQEDFVSFLKELIQKDKLDPKKICIEITEQDTLKMDNSLEIKLNNIKQLGFSIAIDDFSMGHTSINYLKSSMFDMVKLDGTLIKSMKDNVRCIDIIESIVKLGQSLGFVVLAEYVETEDDCKKLDNVGCTKYQGYLFSKAVPIDEFMQKVEKNKADKEKV